MGAWSTLFKTVTLCFCCAVAPVLLFLKDSGFCIPSLQCKNSTLSAYWLRMHSDYNSADWPGFFFFLPSYLFGSETVDTLFPGRPYEG